MARRKIRLAIADDVRAQIIYASDRTCCVCQEPGKPFQIHHVDEDPSNNAVENLVALCLFCHNETQIKGGFGRKLSSADVRRFRQEWVERVRVRRERADAIVIGRATQQRNLIGLEQDPIAPLKVPAMEMSMCLFVDSLPRILSDAYEDIEKLKVHGEFRNTLEMIDANYQISETLKSIWLTLSTYFPRNHFGAAGPEAYIGDIILQKYNWHRTMSEPFGRGTGGSIVAMNVSIGVIADLKHAIVETVHPLRGWTISDEHADTRKVWERLWAEAGSYPRAGTNSTDQQGGGPP